MIPPVTNADYQLFASSWHSSSSSFVKSSIAQSSKYTQMYFQRKPNNLQLIYLSSSGAWSISIECLRRVIISSFSRNLFQQCESDLFCTKHRLIIKEMAVHCVVFWDGPPQAGGLYLSSSFSLWLQHPLFTMSTRQARRAWVVTHYSSVTPPFMAPCTYVVIHLEK